MAPLWSKLRDFSWLARTSPHTHGPGRMFCVGACMYLICLLATFRIDLWTPITFLRLDLNYIVVQLHQQQARPKSGKLIFFKKKTFFEPGPASWVKSGTKKRLLPCNVLVLIR